MALIVAGEAQDGREFQTAYNIARQLDDVFPAGTDVSAQSYDVRDKYTSLAWLGGRVAYDQTWTYSLGPAALYLQAKGAGSRKQIEAARAVDDRREPVEQRLANAVAGRPNTRPRRERDPVAAPATADDAQPTGTGR